MRRIAAVLGSVEEARLASMTYRSSRRFLEGRTSRDVLWRHLPEVNVGVRLSSTAAAKSCVPRAARSLEMAVRLSLGAAALRNHVFRESSARARVHAARHADQQDRDEE